MAKPDREGPVSETFWSERRPGEHAGPVSVAQGREEDGTAEMLLMGDLRVPDRVRYPAELPSPLSGLAGREARVIDAAIKPCPMCARNGREHNVMHWCTEHGIGIAECAVAGFQLYEVGGG